jgi:hypothetical protein
LQLLTALALRAIARGNQEQTGEMRGKGSKKNCRVTAKATFQIRSSWVQFDSFPRFLAGREINNLGVFSGQDIPTPPASTKFSLLSIRPSQDGVLFESTLDEIKYISTEMT